MITTINNNERVFMVTDKQTKVLCNLAGLEGAFNSFESHTYIKIYEIWNYKMLTVPKSRLRPMLTAHQLDNKFIDRY